MPASLMDTPPKPGYPEPYGTLLATLQKSTGSWRYQLETPTQEEVVWQPYPNGHSIGTLILHLAEVETYWVDTVCLGREITAEERELYLSDHMDPFTGIWPTPPNEPYEYFAEIYDRVRAQTLERVKSFGDPQTVVEAEWGTMTLRWVLSHLVWHDGYHGGQAVLLKELRARLR